MSEQDGLSDELRQAALAALQQAAQGQLPAAAESVRPLADRDDPVAIALTAFFLGQSGQAVQGVPYAQKAVKGTIAAGPIAANYVSWVGNDPSLREHVVEFFRAAVDAGWTVDPISQAQQLVQQGDPDRALRLLAEGGPRTAAQAERAWETLTAEIAQSQQRLDADLQSVAESRATTLCSMEEDAQAISAERVRVQGLVGETTALVQNVAANNLAGDYADRARAASLRASRWTIATLIVSAAAILLAAAFVLIGLAKNHDVSTVLSRAAISLPLLALAAYLNKLGTEERRDARSWTHIELQIRTARPYLGNLSDELRYEVQAALALRFFPGQAQDPHGSTGETDADDALRLVREIRARTS